MIRSAMLLGAIGVAFSLISVTIDVLVGFPFALPPEAGLGAIWASVPAAGLEFLLPVAAAVAAVRLSEQPRKAGFVLAGCGAVSPFVGSTTAAVFYVVGGLLALSGPAGSPGRLERRPTRTRAGRAPEAGGSSSLPSWLDTTAAGPALEAEEAPLAPRTARLRIAGLAAAGAGILSGLCPLVWPYSRGPEAGALAEAWVGPAVAVVGCALLGLAGALAARRRPLTGSVVMITAGLAGLLASTLLCAMLFAANSPVGLGPALSAEVLLFSGLSLVPGGRGRARP